MLERNREIVARPLDTALRLRIMLEAYLRWGLAHPNAYQLVYSAPRPVSAAAWSEDTVDLSLQCYEIFAGVVRELGAEGRLRGGAELTAQVLWMNCHGVVSLLYARPRFSWADTDDLVELALNGMMAGLVEV